MDCCAPKEAASARDPCPGCGQVGQPVSAVTVEAILGPARAASLTGGEPRFCRNHSCAVLYYGKGGQSVHKQEANVRVSVKEREDPFPLLCYCFSFSRADIERELAQTGRCTLGKRIAAEVKAGNCDCETKNPAGSCCLGEVNREIHEAELRQAPGARTGP